MSGISMSRAKVECRVRIAQIIRLAYSLIRTIYVRPRSLLVNNLILVYIVRNVLRKRAKVESVVLRLPFVTLANVKRRRAIVITMPFRESRPCDETLRSNQNVDISDRIVSSLS